MGCSVQWRYANNYARFGVTTSKPKVGPGNGSSYGYCHHMKQEGYVGYAYMEHQTVEDVFVRLDAKRLSDERRRWIFEHILKGKNTFTDCHMLYLWDTRDNPRNRKKNYVFLKTYDDAILFKLFLDETKPEIWKEDRIGEPFFGFHRF